VVLKDLEDSFGSGFVAALSGLAARRLLRGFVGTVSEAIDLIDQYQDAGIRFSRPFSSSSAFSRFASEGGGASADLLPMRGGG
jgi:hypothetical protein